MKAIRLNNGDYVFKDENYEVTFTIDELSWHCKEALMQLSNTPEDNEYYLRSLIYHETTRLLRDHCQYNFSRHQTHIKHK